MKAVILAAGKGTRLGKIAKTIPKSLVKISGKPIIEYTLESLPPQVEEVCVVIGHLGNKIKDHLGNEYKDLKIKYIRLAKPTGTATALFKAKSHLKGEKFLILNGDDIYSKADIKKCLSHDHAVGLIRTIPPSPKFLSIKLDKNSHIKGSNYPTKEEMKKGVLIATGIYVLNSDIFRYKPVKLSNGEYGLPQTIFKMAKRRKVKGVLTKKWTQINYPRDIKKAEKVLNKKRG